MQELFQNVLTASFHGSIIILAVLLLRLLLRKAPRKFLCALWILACLRLLMPFEIQSDLSLQPEATPIQQVQWQRPEASAVQGENTPKSDDQTIEPQAAQPVSPEVQTNRPAPSISWTKLVPYAWLAALAVFCVTGLVSYLRLKRQVREAVKIPGGWESDRIDTAFILGFVRPQIYIPLRMSKQNRRYILEHERTHLNKGDHWIKLIGYAALSIHWFNPLVWVMYAMLCKDMEMACDEHVVRYMDVEERKEYSAALLSCAAGHIHHTTCPVAFGDVSVKQRILSVLNYRRPSFWISLLSVSAIGFVAVCLLTSPTGGLDATTQETVPPILPDMDLDAATQETVPPILPDMDLDETQNGAYGENPWGVIMYLDDDLMTTAGAYLCVGQQSGDEALISMDDEYYLEVNKNGTWEALPTIAEPKWSGDRIPLSGQLLSRIWVDWSQLYGALPEGEYRMCKTVSRNDGYHIEQEAVFCTTFRIYVNDLSGTPEAAAAVERCFDAVDALLKQPAKHYTIAYDYGQIDEVYQNGDNYLSLQTRLDTYFDESFRGKVTGQIRLDGVGYQIPRTENGALPDSVTGWELVSADPNSAGWQLMNDIEIFFARENKKIEFPPEIGIISDRQVRFLQHWPQAGSDDILVTKVYSFGEDGKLTSLHFEYESITQVLGEDGNEHLVADPHFMTVTLYPDTADQIDAAIRSALETGGQSYGTFSWEEVQQKYTADAFEIRQSGFVNTQPVQLETTEDVVRRALLEYPKLEYLSVTVARDEAAKMWRVTTNSYYEYQQSHQFYDIYMDDNGITRLTVYEGPISSESARK